jgi:DNA mismatch endonuclease (patch repair protein)
MTDRFSPAKRSRIMASISGKHTRPELLVRHAVSDLGFRYRLHYAELQGKPDLAFPALKKVIFVHGCFWHGHRRCPRSKYPSSRQEFWIPKLKSNAKRDRAITRALLKQGWRVLIVWECQTRDSEKLGRQLKRFLGLKKRTEPNF